MDIVEKLSLPPVKIHCSVLAEDAIKAAINDYRVKNGMDALVFEKALLLKQYRKQQFVGIK